MGGKKSHIILLCLFVTFLVMNAITYSEIIQITGKYGKFIIAFIGILVLQKSALSFKNFVTTNYWLLLFWGICVLFTTFRFLNKGFNLDLFQFNVLFIFFIYYFYFLSLAFQSRHRRPNFHFFKYLANAINANLVFWSIVTFVLPFQIWHTLDDRTGLGLFYENYGQLGIFACVGAIANFSLLRFKIKKNRKLYLIFFLVCTTLVVLSNSRNSELILALFLVLNLFPFVKKVAINYIYKLIVLLAVAFVFFFSSEILLSNSITELTTGRSAIWYYIYDYYSRNSILLGEGIFGLNSTILEDNLNSNYYFPKVTFLYFHSSYIEIFCASGLLGFIFFVVFMSKSLVLKKHFYITIALVSLLVGGLFESFLIQPTILNSFLFWYLIIQRTPVTRKKVYIEVNKLEKENIS